MSLKTWTLLCLIGIAYTVKGQYSPMGSTQKLKEALLLFNLENPTATSDQKALRLFNELSNQKISDKKTAEMVALSSQKAGLLLQMNGKEDAAKRAYSKCLNTTITFQLSDTLQFTTHIYLSELYYTSFAFDSSYVHLHKAENFLLKNNKLPEAGRLFNLMGILYFETGDYRQSIPYFLKAIELRQKDRSDDYALQVNLAMAYLQQGETSKAIERYENLRNKFPDETELLLNLTAAYLEKNEFKKAERILGKLDSTVPHNFQYLVLKLKGEMQLKKENYEAAIEHFQNALKLSPTSEGPVAGDLLINLGNARQELGQNRNALISFNQAIKALTSDSAKARANATTPNPKSYTSSLLMLATARKALTYKKMYAGNASKSVFQNAAQSFESALKMATTLSKSYANEASRLDFSQKIHGYYDAYTDLLLQHGDHQKAFLIADQGKSAVLSMSLTETEKLTGDSKKIKDQIKLLGLKKSALLRKQSSQSESLEKELAALDLEISRTGRLLEHYLQSTQSTTPDLVKIQQKLSPEEVMLSFYEGVDLHGFFVIDREQFVFAPINDVHKLKSEVQSVLSKLKFMRPFDSQDYNRLSTLYLKLLKPLENQLQGKKSILISSDGFLRTFPFEILRTPKHHFLVENYSLTYLFNSSFLLTQKASRNHKILAFAPFSKQVKGFESWTLPASERELSVNTGKVFRGGKATKTTFLTAINSEAPGIVHLATHAKAHETDADLSYIQFYPDNDTLTETRLYLHELQPEVLRRSLVFLSACESFGTREIAGEGIRGLSYGFFRAGASGVISSLWNAEDHTTSELSSLFYQYLQDGFTPAQALQQAKISFLRNPANARFHNPAFWSHLIYHGYEETYTPIYRNSLLLVILLSVFMAVTYFAFSEFKKRR